MSMLLQIKFNLKNLELATKRLDYRECSRVTNYVNAVMDAARESAFKYRNKLYSKKVVPGMRETL